MSTLALSISYVGFTAPAGTVVASVLVTVTNPDASKVTQSLVDGQTSATFTLTQVGSYTITAAALDVTGATIGTEASTTASLAAPTTVTVSIPAALTASVS